MSDVQLLRIRTLPDGVVLQFSGRAAWALDCLVKAGDAGCTPICRPGPRWAAYVFKLKRAGLVIDTVNERHAAPYPGNHARYVLRTRVEIIETVTQKVAA
jgi:hypothetical protein